jgi:Ca2+-binding RTX toxin-like protein
MVSKTPDDIIIEKDQTPVDDGAAVASSDVTPQDPSAENIPALEEFEAAATFDASTIQDTASLNDALPGVNFERKLYGTDYTHNPVTARSYYYNFINESDVASVGENALYLSFFSTVDTSYFGFTGTSGNDVINRMTDDPQFNDIPYVINGYEGEDIITGSNADNLIAGGEDDDILNGNGGDDVFFFEGHNGGIDSVNGGTGIDTILGSGGDDTIGISTINASKSIEVIDGGDGVDTLRASDTGTDFIDLRAIEVRNIEFYDLGDGGTDVFYGTEDADTILTGAGTKRIYGEGGDDTIILKTSHTNGESNEYDGGLGYDQIVVDNIWTNFTLRMKELRPEDSIENIDLGNGYNVIEGTSGGNRLDFSATTLQGVDLIDGGEGSDTITGTSGDDVIKGGAGSDTLKGGDGHDTFLVEGIDASSSARDDFDGGIGTDQILGTSGDDLLRVRNLNADDSIEILDLGAGYDILEARGSSNIDLSGMTVTGLDFINGGTSTDRIIATQGDDTIAGNNGNDIIDGAGGINTAVYSGNFVDYQITDNGDGTFTILDLNTADGNDGRDTLTNINYAQFANYTETLVEPNLVPVATPDNVSVDEDNSVTFSPMANDTDTDAFSIVAIDVPVNGTLVDHGDGTFTYTPFSNFNGSEVLSYTIEDSAGQQSTSSINITVDPVNDAPDARNNGTTINEDETATIDVLGNDRDVDGDTLSIVSFEQPANGSVVQNPDGTFTYTPNGNYFGVDSFEYTITDGEFQDTATVNITIAAANDAPDTVEDNITVEEDAFITFDVLANDSDVDGDTITLESFTLPTEGTLVQNPDGTFTYTPAPDFNGSDSFTYTVSDGTATRVENVNITVDPENDAPITVSDSGTTQEDSSVVIDVLANDTDPDGDTLSVSAVTNGANGTVVINADNTVTYTPNPDFNGSDSFTYTATDGNGGTVIETVSVQVNPENDAPVTVVDNVVLDEDTSTTISVLDNDSDVDGDTLSIDSFTQPASGEVVDNGDGTFTYTPDADYNGDDSFTYTVSDGNGGLTTETVNITVNPVNDDPTVDAPLSVDTDEDTDIVVDVLAQAADIDGDNLSLQVLGTSPQHGSVQIVDGKVLYSPDNNYNGPDSFNYTISDGNGGSFFGTVNVNVAPINDAPNAVLNNVETDEDSDIIIDVLSNDNDVDGDAISLDSFTQPANGSVVQNPDGTFSYTPNPGYNGVDSFTYTITDPAGLTDTATVNVTVNAINDAPETVADDVVLDEDTSATFDVLANDSDPDGDALSVESFTQPTSGAVVQNPDGTFTYTPTGDYNGADSFTYTVSDGNGSLTTETVNITVNPVNDAPVAVDDMVTLDEDASATFDVLANDNDIDGDTLSVESFEQPANGSVAQNPDGTFSYTPTPGFNGADSFTYTVTDGTLTHTATVDITVNPVNDAPETVADDVVLDEDTSATFDVLANDSDPDGDALSVESFTQPANGSVAQNPDGTFTYTPAGDYNGADSFTYTVTDGTESRTETVTLTVNPVNDAPTTVTDFVTLEEDTSATFDVLANDSDIDGDVLSVESFEQPANGSVTQNPDGTFTYTPDENFNGNDTFTYTVTDGIESRTETVNVTVNSVNDLSDTDESITVSENDDFMINVLDNTVNPDGPIDATVIGTGDIRVINNGADITADFVLDPVSLGASAAYRITHTPTGNTGILSINAQGEFALNNETNNLFDFLTEGDNATITLDYTLTDGTDLADSTATINIIGSLDAPITATDIIEVDEDTTATIDVLANDYDVDGDTISVESFTQPTSGNVVQNPDGTFTFTPNADFNGNDSFTYTVTDGTSSVTETVAITVNPVNDAPITQVDNVVLDEDTSATFDVLANDSDVDGDALTVTAFTQGANGVVTQNPDGTFSYTPNADYNGSDTFIYTVSDGTEERMEVVNITVNPVNDAPVTQADDVTLDEDTSATFDVLANDSDVDGDALSVESFTQPTSGAVVQNPDGTFTYTPTEDYNGSDSFTYTVTDGTVSRTETVNITVNPVDDPVDDIVPLPTIEHTIDVTFVNEEAGYKNSFGFVLIDAEGTIHETGLVWENSSRQGSGGSLIAGESTATITVPEGLYAEFFLIANGERVNNGYDDLDLETGSLSFVDENGNKANINEDADSDPILIYTDAAGNVTELDGNIYHTAENNGLNPDDINHVDVTHEDGETRLGFEDLFNGGDRDFDDLLLDIKVNNLENIDTGDLDPRFYPQPEADDFPEAPVVDALPIPEHEVEVVFQGESAGYKNTLGYYTVDASGNIHDVGFVFENSSRQGSGGSLITGVSTETITVPEGQYVEFFAIADGFRTNGGYDDLALESGDLVFLNAAGDAYANINDAGLPQLVFRDDSGEVTELDGHIYHTAGNSLNPDGINHIETEDIGVNDTRLSFEDLFGGGDNDFNDIVVDINIPRIRIQGTSGSDDIDMQNLGFNFYDQFIYPARAGEDEIIGSAEQDIMRGHSGDDILYGMDGNDNLYGGEGADILDGGNGNDRLRYGVDAVWTNSYAAYNHATGDYVALGGFNRTDDIFKGGAGTDRLHATSQNDAIFLHGLYNVPMVEDIETFYLGHGNDILDMSSSIYSYGSFTAHGGDGNDIIWANDGNDTLYGGNGDDWIHGGEGSDKIYLGQGDDFAQGGEGSDRIYGHNGNDDIYGDAGADLLYGGNGNDIIFGGQGSDKLYGMNDDDYISGGTGNDYINGGLGNDVIQGDTGNDTLNGHNGNDSLDGGLGDDVLYGSNGNDALLGGHGQDKLYGGNGDDALDGGSGYDILYGGNGDDLLMASIGFDVLHGGGGEDTFKLDSLTEVENTILRYEHNNDALDFNEILDDLGVAADEFSENLSLDYTSRNNADLVYSDGTTEITFFHFEHIARNLEADDLDIITT